MLKKFDDICITYKNKLCFIDKNNEVSFSHLHSDVLKMVSLFKKYNLKAKDKAVIFVLPSYEFYVLLIAGVYYGLNMVVIDSFKNKERTKDMLLKANTKNVFCTRQTKLLSFILPIKKNLINISNFRKYKTANFSSSNNKEQIVLTTFTSGTTGEAKKIDRSLADLERQMNLVKENMAINPSDIVLGTLPIYVLFSLINGYTTVISKKIDIKMIRKYSVNTILTSIHNLLSNDASFSEIEKVYCGGAIIYPKEANYLKRCFPNAMITYVYGASEGVLIAKTTLDKYIENGYFTFDSFIKGMDVTLASDNEIIISGECVLNDNKKHATGDLGIFTDGKLKIVGRKKYSTSSFYNYVEDAKILAENPNLDKAFAFIYNEQKILVYEGKLSRNYSEFKCFKFKKLPMDLKHKTKLDYKTTINKISVKL